MADFVIKHIEAPQFFTTSATGMIVTGPNTDSTVALCFHRDSMRVKSETYIVPDTIPEGVNIEVEMSPAYEVERLREDVGIISMSIETLESIVRVLNERLAIVKASVAQPTKKAAEIEEGQAPA